MTFDRLIRAWISAISASIAALIAAYEERFPYLFCDLRAAVPMTLCARKPTFIKTTLQPSRMK
jgi:hypothetical protein